MPEHARIVVVVVGAGAGGGAVAWRLAERGATGIVCLEQGDWIDRARLPKAHADWETRARRLWSANPAVRQWDADYPAESAGADPVDVNLYNAVGGSTVYYDLNELQTGVAGLAGDPMGPPRAAPPCPRHRSASAAIGSWPASNGSAGAGGPPTRPSPCAAPTASAHGAGTCEAGITPSPPDMPRAPSRPRNLPCRS